MDIKRVVAREWLYFLGFVFAWVIASLLIYKISYPEAMEAPPYMLPFVSVDYMNGENGDITTLSEQIEHYLSPEEKDKWRKKITALVDPVTGLRSAEAIVEEMNMQYLTYHILALQKYEVAKQNYEINQIRKQRYDILITLLLMVPYSLFMLLRSIRWSIEQLWPKTS